MDSTDGIPRGADVVDTGEPITVPGREATLGRLFNVLGDTIDGSEEQVAGRGALADPPRPADVRGAEADPRDLRDRDQGRRPARAVRQGRQGRSVRRRRRRQDRADPGADPQHRRRSTAGLSVFCGVGERTREGNDLYLEMTESGVIDKTALVYGQMNEPPGARLRVGLSGLTMAEYFREQGQDVLLFIDNIFRFVQAGSEVSALLGRMPSAVGYQPTLATEMGQLQERITSTQRGSITSVQAIYVPADDLTDPAPANTFAHLDATTVLSRAIAEQGIYPAVDPLDSSLARPAAGRRLRRALPDGDARAGDPAALQGPPGHHRHPRHRRALRRGQGRRRAGPQDPALPLAAVLRRRGVHRTRRASTCGSRTRSRASRRSSRASTTTSPRGRSSSSARSTRRSSAAARCSPAAA